MSQTSNIIESYSATRHYIVVKFKNSVQVATLGSDKFTFETIAATPEVVPFKDTVIEDDYNSITRTLLLYFDELPPYSGDYTLKISGVRTSSGYDYPDEALTVPYDFDNEPHEEPVAPDNFVEVEDHSIKENVFTSSMITDGVGFYIKSSKPEDGEVFVEEDFERGRITIYFSERPSSSFITSEYIKVQRKQIGALTRWERLKIQLSMDSFYPRVYIYLPSDDATPVYNTVGATYFEDGYKYRVRISGDMGA